MLPIGMTKIIEFLPYNFNIKIHWPFFEVSLKSAYFIWELHLCSSITVICLLYLCWECLKLKNYINHSSIPGFRRRRSSVETLAAIHQAVRRISLSQMWLSAKTRQIIFDSCWHVWWDKCKNLLGSRYLRKAMQFSLQ